MNKNNSTDNANFPTEKTATSQPTIAVVQMTRIGDIIQTLQAAKLFKSQRPDINLILIARQQFAAGLTFILNETFDKIIYVDSKVLTNQAKDLSSCLNNLRSLLNTINTYNINVLINLSFSTSSAYLCSLIKAHHKMGLFYDNNHNLNINDLWSQFIYSNVMGSSLNPFSLVDIFKTMLGTSKSQFISNPRKVTNNKIVLHPFTSLAKKHWKISKWSEIIYQVLKELLDVEIIIVGTKKDAMAINEIINAPLLQRYANRITNLCGKTTLEQLFSILSYCAMFVGHDSMVGHMASLAGTQTLTISLGTVRPFETTPYGQKNYNIIPSSSCYPCFPSDPCSYFHCHSDIPYQVVCSSIVQLYHERIITQTYLEKNNTCFLLNSVDILETSFTNEGYLNLKTVLHKQMNLKEIFRTYYRICWQYLFNSIEESSPYPELTQNTHQQLLQYLNGLQYLFELNNFGQKYCRYILEEISSSIPRIDKIKEYSVKIDEIDELQKLIKQTYPLLSSLIDYTTIQKGYLKGDNIVQLTESAFIIYHQSSNLVQTIHELIEKTITEHKIKNNINVLNAAPSSLNE